MKKTSTPPARRIKITDAIREAYAKRDQTLDTADSDAPVLPPEMWEHATRGKFYRPVKTAVSVRIDNDVIAWLKSQGDGYLSRMNDLLRSAMLASLKSRDKRQQ